MMHLYSKCIACKKDKFFVRTRRYVVSKGLMAKNPHLAPLNGMRSDGELCTQCFNGIKRATGL